MELSERLNVAVPDATFIVREFTTGAIVSMTKAELVIVAVLNAASSSFAVTMINELLEKTAGGGVHVTEYVV